MREAGELALRMSRTELRAWIKGASSPVSEADIAVNDLIQARLQPATPDYGWLSEESADDSSRLDKPFTWIVDPIDGTRSYLARQEDWSISVALVSQGSPLLAAVFAPARDEFFFATYGRGASLNGQQITASPGAKLDFSRIAGPKPLIERLSLSDLGLPDEGISIHPRIGSLALRLARVGEGRIDVAFATSNSRDWDLAAADLIVHEAGGKLTTLAGESLVYNLADGRHGILVAAGYERHTRIINHFRNHPVD